MDDLITTKKYLARPDLFGLSYRTWACSRIALVQCELFLDENNIAVQSVQRMRKENEEIREAYLYPLQHFDENPIPLAAEVGRDYVYTERDQGIDPEYDISNSGLSARD